MVTVVQSQPDIQYQPDFEKYLDRSRRRQQSENLPTVLPPGLAQELSSPFVWDGKDVENREDWIVTLTDTHLKEIDQSLNHFKCKYTSKLQANIIEWILISLISIEQTPWIHQPINFSVAKSPQPVQRTVTKSTFWPWILRSPRHPSR